MFVLLPGAFITELLRLLEINMSFRGKPLCCGHLRQHDIPKGSEQGQTPTCSWNLSIQSGSLTLWHTVGIRIEFSERTASIGRGGVHGTELLVNHMQATCQVTQRRKAGPDRKRGRKFRSDAVSLGDAPHAALQNNIQQRYTPLLFNYTS